MYPILRGEVGAAVQSLKKWKSAGVDNIPAELGQAGREDVITALTTVCNKIWQTVEWPTTRTQSSVITLPKKATCSSARTTEQSAYTRGIFPCLFSASALFSLFFTPETYSKKT